MIIPKLMADSKQNSEKNLLDAVTIKYEGPDSFQDNKKISINFSVKNDSDFLYRMVYANGIYDLELKLTGPDGSQISGYHEMKDSHIGGGAYKFSVGEIPPHQKIMGDAVPLSLYWPLEKAGVYRCILTKRIYRQDPARPNYQSASEPGIPVEIVSPEFDFRIESIDPTFKSEAAKLVGKTTSPKVFEEIPDKEQESKRTAWNIGLIGIICILVSFLGFSCWKRKT